MNKIELKKCRLCGREFEPKNSKTQLCSEECIAAARKISTKKTQERIKQKNRERWGIRICLECGIKFQPRNGIQVCCNSICQRERNRKLEKSWREEMKKEMAKKGKKKKPETLASVNEKARAAGMTYGQYQLYLQMNERSAK